VDFKGDYHIHSTYSDGRGTLSEIAAAARECNLTEVGISDHGPRNIGTGVKNEKVFLTINEELRRLQRQYPSLVLRTGAEADVISPDGTLDISKSIIERLDYLLVGLHPYVLPRGIGGAGWVLRNLAAGGNSRLGRMVRNQNTKALVEAVYRHDVMAVTHPGLKMEIDIPEAARACIARDTAWEINTGHKFPGYTEVREAARCGVDFIVNSDAHYVETVGSFQYGSWVLEKAGVPGERVKNAVNDGRK